MGGYGCIPVKLLPKQAACQPPEFANPCPRPLRAERKTESHSDTYHFSQLLPHPHASANTALSLVAMESREQTPPVCLVALPRLRQGSGGGAGQWISNPTTTTRSLFKMARKCALGHVTLAGSPPPGAHPPTPAYPVVASLSQVMHEEPEHVAIKQVSVVQAIFVSFLLVPLHRIL